MSHVMVDGRTLTDPERIKFCADMETEDAMINRAARVIELGHMLKSLRKERNKLDATIANLQAEFDRMTAEAVQS